MIQSLARPIRALRNQCRKDATENGTDLVTPGEFTIFQVTDWASSVFFLFEGKRYKKAMIFP